jgi:hypothetical protein
MSTGCLIGHRRRRRGKPVLRRKDPTGVRSPQRKQVPDTPDRVYANLTAGKSQSSPEGSRQSKHHRFRNLFGEVTVELLMHCRSRPEQGRGQRRRRGDGEGVRC